MSFSVCTTGFGADPIENLNPGPRSNEESDLLYHEATEAISQKKCPVAIRDLERFLDRYSSSENANNAYLSLMECLFNEKKNQDVIRYGKELLNRKIDRATENRAKTLISETHLNLKEYLEARLVSDELLKNEPTEKQKATAYSIKFQGYLEEKFFDEAEGQLDALVSFLQKTPIDSFSRLIPEFKMTLDERKCEISHLLKNKQFNIVEADAENGPQFTEEELSDYFTKKNLCLKSALPATLTVTNKEVIHEWCESFSNLNHELERLKIDPFLKQKITKDLKATFDFSKTLSPDLSKCYEPIKTKKRHRKRRVHSS